MKKSVKAFVFLSLVIILVEVVIVAFNYHRQQVLLEENLQQKISQVKSSFDLAYEVSRQRMLEIASYVSNSTEIQQAFLAGRKAVESEGGGAGHKAAALARERLLEISKDSWQSLENSFDFRQMHFHLAPGSTSFLRVHKPERFGDDLSDIRYTVVAANKQKMMVSGFETGKLYAGIRGVVPVFAYDRDLDERVHVGALEFGTSFEETVRLLAENQGVDLAILLNLEQLKDDFWPGALQQRIAQKGTVGNFLIEESTLAEAQRFFAKENLDSFLCPSALDIHAHGRGHHWLASFPLRDFKGEQDAQREPFGCVVIVQDATENIQILHENLRSNIIIAVLGFIVIEVLLFLVLRLTTSALERLVEAGRRELALKNIALKEDLATIQQMQVEKDNLISELQVALEEVQTLSGLLPICAYCKKIRDDGGYWNQLELYIESKTTAQFSHGICDDCLEEHFSGVMQSEDKTDR